MPDIPSITSVQMDNAKPCIEMNKVVTVSSQKKAKKNLPQTLRTKVESTIQCVASFDVRLHSREIQVVRDLDVCPLDIR